MYTRILVPVDGSKTSQKAAAEAARLAKLTGARLKLLHIVDPLAHINGFETPATYLSELRPVFLKVGEQLVAQAKADIDTEEVNIETQVVESAGERVSEIIVDQAREWGADLIVLGTHGRRGIERVMMGSDAEQVARIAPVPVLLVRHAEWHNAVW